MSSRQRQLAGLLGFAWLFAVTVVYFTTHKPFTSDVFWRGIVAFWQLFLALWIVSVAGGAGLRLAQMSELPPLARQATQALLGLGIFALGVLLTGATIGISTPGFWLVLVLLTLVLARSTCQWWQLGSSWRGLWVGADKVSRWMLIMVGFLMFCSLAISLAPPVQYDSLVYHLVLPEAYLRAGRVVHLSWNDFSGMPQVIEMLYTWIIALGGRSAAAVLGWIMAALVLSGMVGSACEAVGDVGSCKDETDKKYSLQIRQACASAALLLSGYTLAISSGWAYVDWGALAFGWCCLMCLAAWRLYDSNQYILLAGVFGGFAMGTKYTAGIILVCGFVVVIWQAWHEKIAFSPLAIKFLGTACLVSLPWWVKNYLFTGNPFSPFYFFLGSNASDVGSRIYQANPPWGTWQDIFLLPFQATVLGAEGGAGYGSSIGPLLLGLGVFCWCGWRMLSDKDRVFFETAVIISVTGILTWIIANRFSGFLIQTRMYYPIFPALAVLAGAGYTGLSEIRFPNLRLGRLVTTIVILVLGLNCFEVFRLLIARGSLDYLLGQRSETGYIVDNLGPFYLPVMKEIYGLPAESQALLLFEPRSLYCQPKCQPDDHLDRWKQAVRSSWDPDQIRSQFISQGYSYLLVNKKGAEFMRSSGDPHYTSEEWHMLDNFQAYLLRRSPPTTYGDDYILYSLE